MKIKTNRNEKEFKKLKIIKKRMKEKWRESKRERVKER